LEERFGMAQFSRLLGHIEPIAHEDTRSALTLAQVTKKSGLVEARRITDQTAKPPTKELADGFALSPLDSALQALPRNAPSGLVEPAVSLRARRTYGD
jgi:hypothetical protein